MLSREAEIAWRISAVPAAKQRGALSLAAGAQAERREYLQEADVDVEQVPRRAVDPPVDAASHTRTVAVSRSGTARGSASRDSAPVRFLGQQPCDDHPIGRTARHRTCSAEREVEQVRQPPSSAAGVRGYERIGAAARVCVRLRHSPERCEPGDGAVVHNRAENVPNVTDDVCPRLSTLWAVMLNDRRYLFDRP